MISLLNDVKLDYGFDICNIWVLRYKYCDCAHFDFTNVVYS